MLWRTAATAEDPCGAGLDVAGTAAELARSAPGAAMNIHAPIPNPEVNLAHPGTVASLLVVHRGCTPGNGDTPGSCSARRMLLAAADVMGVSEPTPERARS